MNKHILQHVKAPVALAFVFAAAVMTSACSSNDKDKVKDALEEAEGKALFELNCASCHTGNGMGDGTTGGDISNATADTITAALNNVAAMSAVEDLSTNQIAALANALSSDVSYENADGIKGGQLYSKFWVDQAGDFVETSMLNEAQIQSINASADFFRCKQCHGWDRLGREGGYSDRAPKTTRPNVSGIDLASLSASTSAEDLFAKIKKDNDTRRDLTADLSTYDPETNSAVGDMMPNYSQILTNEQIWNIVKFLKAEALDTTALYDISFPEGGEYPSRPREFSDIGKDGQPSNGDAIYAQSCAGCHGADGTGGTVGLVDGGEYTVGRHVRAKPYEDQHKVKFGHLGSVMGPILKDSSIEDIKDLLAALSNPEAYPDEVPVALDGEALFNDNCAGCHTPEARAGRTATQITDAIANVADMSNLSLTADEIQAIADWLPAAPTLDGAALFTDNCGGCHIGNGLGTGTFGDVTNASAAFIASKIASVALMASLSSLTTAEVDAIALALADL